jgi:hypothetical protein
MAVGTKTTNLSLANITAALAAYANVGKYVGWGTGATTPAVTDTDLATAAAEARTSGTVTQQTTTAANDTLQVVAAITCATTGKAITEVGWFDALTTGNMIGHSNFAVINVAVGDSITFTIKTAYSDNST